MHYVLFYEVVDDYVAKRAPFRDAHLQYAQKAVERGELLLGGAFTDPVDGAMLVFRGSAADAAEGFAKSDPYVLNGMVKSWRVRKWVTVVGEGVNA